MGNGHPAQTNVRFAEFEADFRSGELRKDGARVNLQEQPLLILRMLVEQPGRLVTRAELQKKIWPERTFVDFEQGLYNAVKRLREALRDSAESPRFIETLSRRGYRFIGTIDTSPRQIQSLAVLPLEDLSRDPEQAYFADGLTEALINTLSKIGQLRVISRTSAMQYKGVHKPLGEIARELGVAAVVEGTVMRFENRVRITAQLIDTSKETHLWSESYERDLRDVLELQSELARAIAREIQVKLAPVDQARFGEMRPVEPECYEAYLRGRFHWHRRNVDGFGKAIQYFQQAIAKDPSFPAAYAGLADCLSVLGWWSFASPDTSCGKAKALAQKAVEMDRNLAEAHASLGFATMLYDHEFARAEREFERSIELNPRYATAHQWFGVFLAMMGRYEESIAELKRANRLDPHSIINQSLGFVYFNNRHYDQAIEQFEKALELDDGLAQAHCVLGLTYAYKGMHDAAIEAVRKAVELSHGATLFVGAFAEILAVAGYRDKAEKILEQLNALPKQRYVSSYDVARIHAALGRKDEALRFLESAYQERATFMIWLKTDARFDEFRSDPCFQDLLRRMNFPS
jgi:TolB-like protein/Tfp pilus assembly protein PilF